MNQIHIIRTLALLSLLSASHAHATPTERKLALSFGFLHQNYGEYNDMRKAGRGAYLDEERGSIPGITLALSSTSTSWFGELRLSHYEGDTHYDGALFDPNTGDIVVSPYYATTRNSITELTGRPGLVIAINEQIRLKPHLEFGYHFWRRDLGFIEDYEHFWGGVGLIGQYRINSGSTLELEGMFGQTGEARIDVPDFALHAPLGNSSTYRLGLGLTQQRQDGLQLFGKAGFRRFDYGASPVNAYGFYEPRSFTEHATVQVGVSRIF